MNEIEKEKKKSFEEGYAIGVADTMKRLNKIHQEEMKELKRIHAIIKTKSINSITNKMQSNFDLEYSVLEEKYNDISQQLEKLKIKCMNITKKYSKTCTMKYIFNTCETEVKYQSKNDIFDLNQGLVDSYMYSIQ